MAAAKKTRLAKTSYDTKYPFNKVSLTESGHECHFDDTPGKCRIRIAHKSGSYFEWSEDGRKVSFTVGNEQKYNKGGYTVTIEENEDRVGRGHKRDNQHGGTVITVKGDADVVAGGHSNIVVGGNAKCAVAGDCY